MEFKDNGYLGEQLKSGDRKAYGFLMDTYYKSLCIYAFTLINDHSKAEDIVQDVLVVLWTNHKQVDPELPIKNYLYRSVYNRFIDEYRKRKPSIYLEKKYLEALEEVIEEDSRDFEKLIKLVYNEIENLPPKCKKIFLMNKKEGMTHVEISEYLDISVKTVEGHISRAFKVLEKGLTPKIKPLLFLLFGEIDNLTPPGIVFGDDIFGP